jgi:ribosomal protein S25
MTETKKEFTNFDNENFDKVAKAINEATFLISMYCFSSRLQCDLILVTLSFSRLRSWNEC